MSFFSNVKKLFSKYFCQFEQLILSSTNVILVKELNCKTAADKFCKIVAFIFFPELSSSSAVSVFHGFILEVRLRSGSHEDLCPVSISTLESTTFDACLLK